MEKDKCTKAANILFNNRINKKRLDKLPIDCIPSNIEEAYKIQDELKIIYLNLKDNYIIGKKVGCTNKWAQNKLMLKNHSMEIYFQSIFQSVVVN